MATLTQEMKDLVAQQQCFVATVNADGTPTVGPKHSTHVFDDEHLVFSEATGNRTWANVQRGSKVAIAVVDHDSMKGFRFEGRAKAITSGTAFDKAADMLKQHGIMTELKAVVKVRVERVFNLGMPGAGEEIL